MNWKPGDIAIIAFTSSGNWIGKTCTVTAIHLNKAIYIPHLKKYESWPVVVEVDVHGIAQTIERASKPEWLRKPDDGIEPASWDDCVFKPRSFKHDKIIQKLEALKWP